MAKVLIVVDMQNDFIDGSLGTSEAQDIVNNVVREIEDKKNEDYLIVATQDTHHNNYLETFEGKNLPVEHCIKNTKGWEIPQNIKNKVDIIIEKPTFGSKKLVDYLKKINPEEIELLGLCTDICVISNALLLREAFPNKVINVKENCCAGVTPELHKSALDVMKSCQINIL